MLAGRQFTVTFLDEGILEIEFNRGDERETMYLSSGESVEIRSKEQDRNLVLNYNPQPNRARITLK